MSNHHSIEVLILAGGKGSRLKDILPHTPKPMAPINGKPFLHYLITYLKNHHFSNICILSGHMAEQIQDYLKDGSDLGVQIRYSHEESPLGTGGAIKKAISSSVCSEFIILNGDTFFEIKPEDLITNTHMFCIGISRNNNSLQFGNVTVDSKGVVTGFLEKEESHSNFVNAGYYYCHHSICDFIDEGMVSLENDVLPILVSKGLVYSRLFNKDFIDIGTPSGYETAKLKLPPTIPIK